MKRKSMRKFEEHGGQARALAFVAYRVVRPLLWLILTLGSVVWVPLAQMANAQARVPVLMDGYSPTSMNTSNLPQAKVVHHDKNFVKNLKPNTCFLRLADRRELPEMSGNQHRLYMYNRLGANANQTAEGTVGSGITVSVVNTTATIGQFADYVNLSDYSMQTAIDNALENIHKELAFRLGYSISTLGRNTLDGAATIDASASIQNAAAAPFTRANITSAVQSLTGRDVQPFEAGHMAGAIHPFVVGDALNDVTTNSLTDILKRTAEGQEKLSELPSPDGDNVPVLEWGGVRFHQTSMVTQTSNYLSSGKTALRTYIVGEDGLIAISLGKREGAQIGEGDWRNLKLWMFKPTEPSPSDPSRLIGGWTSYNVKIVYTFSPDTTMRVRLIDSVSNIS